MDTNIECDGGNTMEKYCEMCKNPFFAAANERICGNCKQKEKEQKYLDIVTEYIKENPGSPVAVVINETNVPYEVLQKFILEKRVDLVLDPHFEEQQKREKQRLFNELANAKKALQNNDSSGNAKMRPKDNLSYQILNRD